MKLSSDVATAAVNMGIHRGDVRYDTVTGRISFCPVTCQVGSVPNRSQIADNDPMYVHAVNLAVGWNKSPGVSELQSQLSIPAYGANLFIEKMLEEKVIIISGWLNCRPLYSVNKRNLAVSAGMLLCPENPAIFIRGCALAIADKVRAFPRHSTTEEEKKDPATAWAYNLGFEVATRMQKRPLRGEPK